MSAKKKDMRNPKTEIGMIIYDTNGMQNQIREAILGLHDYNPRLYGWQTRINRIIRKGTTSRSPVLFEICWEHQDAQSLGPSVVRIVRNQLWQGYIDRFSPSAIGKALEDAGLEVERYRVRMEQGKAFGRRTPRPYEPPKR
jgi:hypothetical protein